jgi:polyketide synthase PksL
MKDALFNGELHNTIAEMALRVFRAGPVSEQPRCVVHIGAGDGDLLRKMDEALRKLRSPEELQKFPVTLVKLGEFGDGNREIADQRIWHVTVRESRIDEASKLKALGTASSDDILWVSTCLEPKPAQSAASVFASPLQWSNAIGKHGIIVAQAVSLPSQNDLKLAREDSAPGAESTLMAAAALGLFPRSRNLKMLAAASATGLLLAHFEGRNNVVRFTKEEDLPVLMRLEQRCWAAALQAPVDEIRLRIHRYPAGQLVLEMNGVVCGVIYSQRIHALEALSHTTCDRVGQLHADSAPLLQLLAVNILPEYQQMNLGDQLLEFMLQRASVMSGVESVAAVTLCKRYSQHRQYSMHEYIRWRTERGKLRDPILRFHELHGATIRHPIANYRPADKENEGYGVLVTYDLQQRRRDEIVTADIGGSKAVPNRSLQPGDIQKGVEEIIKGMLGLSKETDFARTRPLMEMGLNSADLISLGEAIRFEYHVDLETTFFFQCNTTEKIALYLSEKLCGKKDQERSIPEQGTGPARAEDESAPGQDAASSAVMRPEDIAIIGIGCRLPGGIHGPEQLWEFLIEGRDAITHVPAERWEWPDEIEPGRSHPGIDRGGFLTDVARFDARFFRITPREAELMDPQQRILLELTWETLEDAGCPASALMGTKTGVFVGASGSDYALLLQKSLASVDAHIGTGAAGSILANRISYFYDLRGPSLCIDTACSSSLVALHAAIRSLRGGECEQALVAGVNVMCHPGTSIAYYKAGMLAKDGLCKTFDKDANGYVRSEGAVMVFLKPLARALADRNFIHAVVKGSAMNHGGQASGLTVPNPEEQSVLLLNACRDADVSLHTVGYLEAHGTGTSLGDPIEVKAIQESFGLAEKKADLRPMRCGIGSIKTNVGHLEAAAGLAGLIKAALSLKNAFLPRHRNFKELNPRISFSDSPLFVVEENMPWEVPASGFPRRAGVSSFGSGGANAHAVLEEYRRDRRLSSKPIMSGPWLFVLSAKTAERLQAHAERVSTYIKSKKATLGEDALYSMAFTLQTGREAFDLRLAVIASSADEIVAKLDRFCAGERDLEDIYHGDTKDLSSTGKILAGGVGSAAVVRDAVEDKDFSKIGALWCAGASVGWKELYGDYRAEKCFLPTYPFAGDHYWIDSLRDGGRLELVTSQKALHPLLDRNASTLAEQKFTKRLHREEIFLKHHVVQGLTILPGVAHLEMARAAAELSLGRPVQVMKNIIWGRPVVLDGESKDVVIALHADSKGIDFEIRNVEGSDAVFSRGKIDTDAGEHVVSPHARVYDPKAVRERSKIRKNRAEIFSHFENLGFKYGIPFQLTDELYSGETEALASLVPSTNQTDSGEYQLNPALMDSAIRTSFLIGLGQNSYNDRLRIPFSLGKLQVFSSLDNARYAYARIAQEGADGDYVSHVSILDEDGAELLLFEDFLAKTFRQKKTPSSQGMRPSQLVAGPGSSEEIGEAQRTAEPSPSHSPASAASSESQVQAAPGDNQRFEKIVGYLKDKISVATKAPAASIASQEPLSSYGIDSVMIMELNRSLEADFDSLPGTLFFQYGTVQDLAKYFINNHADRLGPILGGERYSQASGANDSEAPTETLNRGVAVGRFLPVKESGFVGKNRVVSDYGSDVAIIGLSGRYPKASNLEDFWENLKLGVDGIEEIPAARWDYRKYYSPNVKQPGLTNSKWGGFVENIDKFDAAFFNISPREADYIDPQQRLFLEVAWAACEDAGYSWERTRNLDQLPKENNVGVFVGLMYDDYHFFERQVSTSYWNSFVANRVSHFFNFRGPSMTVDTACSSSLTSIYMAYEALRNGHCYAAIAGGTNLSIHPRKYARLSQLNMLSSEGRCRSFGKGGNGYVPGEGVGAVLLKRLEDAVRDGDHIYAVIKGGALNHGGKTNGFTVPNPNAQAELISAALRSSGVPPRTISYIEAHGTGTELGDPIEIAGLTSAFRKHTADRRFCVIGSVKSNIGHLEGAAGIAALTKVVLQLQHQQHAPSLHAQVTNPLIDFQNSPFTLAQELAEWKRPLIEGPDGNMEYPRRAGISSFGAGGANAHLILEEYIEPDENHADHVGAVNGRSPVLVPLSAKTEESLKAYVQKLLEFCRGQQADLLGIHRMAFTLQTGRQAMEWRVAFLANDMRELCPRLEAFLAGKDTAGCHHDQVRRGNELANVFGVDEELQEAVGKWMAKRKMDRLAQWWVKGLEIDWTQMYGEHRPRRISLPTYPFTGERYWVPNEKESGEDIVIGKAAGQAKPVTQAASTLAAPSDSAMNLLTFREEWKPEPSTSRPPTMSSVIVVYFATETSPAETFAATMQAQGFDAVVVRVEHGDAFARLDRSRYQLHSSNRHEYQQLLDSLERDGLRDCVIVDRWAEGQELEGIRGIYDLLSAIGRRRGVSRLVLTSSLNDGLASCYDHSWIGYERSLKLILPGLSFTLLYSEGTPLTDEIILQEIWSSGVVRYRAGERFRLGIAEAQIEAGAQPVLRRNGVYLITGGCGELGELFAEYLASGYQARLALMGRRAEDEAIRQKLARVTRLGAAAVAYYAGDASDGAAMRSTIAGIQARFGHIDGIIHAAGIGPSRTIFDKEWNDFHSVLQPKLSGSIALDEATAGLDLDFICYFSSSSAVLGDFGSCDYSIGNRFEMAFGLYRQRQSEKGDRRGKSIVINWPLWREGGMTIGDRQQTEMYLKSSGQRYLERDEGLRTWELILNAGVPQVLALAGDAARIRRSLARLYGMPDFGSMPAVHVGPVPAISTGSEEDSGANGRSKSGAPQAVLGMEEQIVRDVRASVSKVLNLPEDRLDDEVIWGEFGFDSILLGELGKVVSEHLQVEIAPSLFFSYSTIKKFCSYLLQEKGLFLETRYKNVQNNKEQIASQGAVISIAQPQETRFNQEVPVRTSRDEETPIAIIGLAGRFPGADNVEELWRVLVDGRTTLTEVPADRWNWHDYYFGAADKRNTIATNRGGFVQDVSAFDPLFFEISPREAELMEPRQRLLLEEAWHAFEDAGYSGKKLRGSGCGVFIGVEEGDHAYLAKHQGLTPGNHNAMLAARISYYLDLQGPNLAINTACSSGLVALHLACQSLRSGECQMALAGGISLLLSPAAYLMLSNMGMLSPEGQCQPFDQRATGMVPAEAVGVVVLKPLPNALEDRDQIYAVIKGSGTNYDGRTNGITSPNALSQAALLEKIFARHRIDPAKLQLVLAHSAGSPLGDPIEVQALSQAIRKYSDARQFCALSSIKPLLGHSFAASGVVNLIAMCMALKHQTMPATRCERPCSHLDLETSPLFLIQSNTAWRSSASAAPRTGLVGATGMSGTNACVVLEEPASQAAEPASPAAWPDRDFLVPLSAKSPSALEELAGKLRKFLMEHGNVYLADVAYTLQAGREAMTYRAVIIVRDTEELIDRLREFTWHGSGFENCYMGEAKKRNRTTLSPDDETLHNAIGTWKNQGTGDTLAQLWIKGADFNWDLLYDDVKPRRISLPTYPFVRRQIGIVPRAASLLATDDAVQNNHSSSSFTGTRQLTGPTKTRRRICVVGSGPSGLVMAKSLKEEGHEPVIYEKQDALGGLWVLRPDKSAGAYKKTRFQTSKYTSVFSDFFVDDIASSFYSVNEVQSYLDRYAKHFQVEELVQYNSEVLSVHPSGGKWKVAVRHAGFDREDEFDGVAMCHGMFWKQKIPAVPGFASFPGASFHSGQYYDNSVLRGKRVLVIGNGVSGMDIAEEASEVADSVFWSLRSLKLVLPRMVGFVPNDCQSIASLLLPSNRVRQVDRLRHSMPDYFQFYERSGLLPSHHDLERNPTIHINDNVVRLVAEGTIQVCPEVANFEGKQCRFADHTSTEVDVVVFCTGYDNSACEYVPGVEPGDFSMGIFYHRNPTLVNAMGLLPIAFSGSFFFFEMVARWYSQVLSGKYRLSEAELQQRITIAHRAVIGPIASLLFGLKLGFFPSPEREFKEFWKLLNYPNFPMLYRLRGEHSNQEAHILLEDCRKKAFVKTDEHDPELRELKHRILAGMDQPVLERLLASGEITQQDYSGAQVQRENALKLDWDMQYIQQEARVDLAGSVKATDEQAHWPQELQDIFERVRTGELDAARLTAVLCAETESV